MSLATFFGFGGGSGESSELPVLWKLPVLQAAFVELDTEAIYAKILTDVAERCHGLNDDQQSLLFDNCVKSSNSDGLITLFAKGLSNKSELFLVYDKSIKVFRTATGEEIQQIREDYKKQAQSSVGVFISFKNNSRADMMKLYSGIEFNTICGLNKNINLATAIQFKMSKLRESVGVTDADEVKAQAKAIATGMAQGRDALLDGEDKIELPKLDMKPTTEAIAFLEGKRSFYLNMPASYINGILSGGLGATGEADQNAVERGLKHWFFAVMKPALEALFDATITYKSQNYRMITQALEALKTFDLTSNDFLNDENKKAIIEGLLGIDSDDNKITLTEGDDTSKEKDVTNSLPPGAKKPNEVKV